MSVRLPLCPSVWNNWAATGQIFIKNLISEYFRKSAEKIQVLLKIEQTNAPPMKINIHFLITFLSVFLIIRNISDNCLKENKKSFMFDDILLSNVRCETTWKYVVEPGRPQMTIRPMRITCWIPKATNTQSKYVILVFVRCNSGCTKAPQCYVTRTLPL
jgi:hypothetical protein